MHIKLIFVGLLGIFIKESIEFDGYIIKKYRYIKNSYEEWGKICDWNLKWIE